MSVIEFCDRGLERPLFSTHPVVISRWVDDIKSRGMKVPVLRGPEKIVGMAYLPGVAWVIRVMGHTLSIHRTHIEKAYSFRGSKITSAMFGTFFAASD